MALLWLPSGPESILIVLAVLILFGANKVPQFMRGLGQGVREFKKAVSSDDEDTQPVAPAEKENAEKKA
jgi:sec-independent protein translocase protein TatA